MTPNFHASRDGRRQRGSPEADHERGVVAPLYGGTGIRVYANSIRAHPVGASPGIADLTCFTPWGFTFFHETKVGTYRQSKEQRDFMQDAFDAGAPYVLGDATSASAFLCWLGIAVPLNETVRFHPRDQWRGRVWQRIEDARQWGLTLGAAWRESEQHEDHLNRWGYRG